MVAPLVEVVDDPDEVARLAAMDPSAFDWLVVTSPNGARAVVESLRGSASHVAAVGASTAEALRRGGTTVDLVPVEQRAEVLLAELPGLMGRVLVVQAATAEPDLVVGLRARGAEVTVVMPYRTVSRPVPTEVRAGVVDADAVLFASGSAATAWVEAFGTATPPVVVAIGPQTAAAARRAGLVVTVTADRHSLEGLVDALAAHWA